MQGLIHPHHYTDEPHWRQELAGLFANQWIFVGLLSELQGLSHRGVRVGARELLVQCDKQGRPRAYLNACVHRHAQVCGPGLHQGAVRCPYHGWVYDREGVPVGIPQPQAFADVLAQPGAHRLQEFPCETAGQFVFVRQSGSGPTLSDYLGVQYAFLAEISQGLGSVQDEFRQEVSANWKVVIENALEGYHVPAVHNQTFMQIDGMQRGYEAPQDFIDQPLHSHMNHPADPQWLASFKRRVEPHLGQWVTRNAHYTHHHIFPNLTVTSFMGYSFHVQVFEPTAVDRTTVHSRTLGVLFDGQSPTGGKMIERIYADGHAFTHKVFAEDGGICAKVHAGLKQSERLAVLGDGIEARVAHFHQAYVQALAASSPLASQAGT